MKNGKKYYAWKSDKNGEPIEDTDRILLSSTKRNVIKHLADEEKVPHNHNDVLVRCKDGTTWHVRQLY